MQKAKIILYISKYTRNLSLSFNILIKVDVDKTFASSYMNVLVHGDGIIYYIE